MAGYDVVIAGFRLNAKEPPAKVLERVLSISAEEARICAMRFPHVALSNAPREAAEALRLRLDEAGARVAVTPHEPGAVVANDTARAAASPAQGKPARSVSLAAVEPLDVQGNARNAPPPQQPRSRTGGATAGRPPTPAVEARVSEASEPLGAYALGELSVGSSPQGAAAKAPAPPKPAPALKPPPSPVKNDFDLEEDFASGSGLDLDLGGAAQSSQAEGRGVAPAKLRNGAVAVKARPPAVPKAAPPDAFSIGGGGRDLDDTFGENPEGAEPLELDTGRGSGNGSLVSRHKHHKRPAPQAQAPKRRDRTLLYVAIVVVFIGAAASAWLFAPWFRAEPSAPVPTTQAPDGLLAISGEEPLAAALSMRRGAKEGVIVPAHEVSLEVRKAHGPVLLTLRGRFADRSGHWIAAQGDPQALRGREFMLSALDDQSGSDPQAFMAWPEKDQKLAIERVAMIIEEVGAYEPAYAPRVYQVKAHFSLELETGERREAAYSGHLRVHEPK